VQAFGRQIEDALAPGGGGTAGLLDEEGHRVGFVQQAQLAGLGRILGVLGVHEDAAAGEDAMHFGNHRGDPAHVEVLAARTGLAGQAFVDVALHRFFPETHVRRVDREFLGFSGDLHVGVGQHEFADVAVEREAVGAVAEGQHQHGRRTVDRIAGAHLLGAGLQEVFGDRSAAGDRRLQDREDGADRDVDVDVRRTVERVEHQQVLAERVLVGDRIEFVHFLGRHAGEVAAPLVGADHDVVGDDVELLLRFALHVLGIQRAHDAQQCALVDDVGNRLAGNDDVVQQ